jgi:hypothetical protein
MDATTIIATTTDAEIEALAEEMWPCIDLPKDAAKAAFADVVRAYRRMLDDMTPAKAVTTISTIALFVSGQDYDAIPGPRAKVRL